MKPLLRKAGKWALIGLGASALGLACFVLWHVRAYDQSTTKRYDIPLVEIPRRDDVAALERGKHLAESLGECVVCHGTGLAGGKVEPMGPLGRVVIPNVSPGGRIKAYSDAELSRLIRHGIKRDGTTVRLMPANVSSWWPDEDVAALIAWMRSRPALSGDPGVFELTAMGKLLDRFDSIPIDVARRIDHARVGQSPAPAANAIYGAYVGTSCRGCHAPTLAGGPIPGAPPGLAVPLNLTPHETGLKGWTFDDFKALVHSGKRKNGKPLDPFMPVDALRNLNELELTALWAYLQSAPPRPFGERG
jgi:mono/diheme cytochrome c family protein